MVIAPASGWAAPQSPPTDAPRNAVVTAAPLRITVDGALDEGESGMAGVTFELLLGGNVVGSQVSGNDGQFWFVDLAPGDYTVHEVDNPDDDIIPTTPLDVMIPATLVPWPSSRGHSPCSSSCSPGRRRGSVRV